MTVLAWIQEVFCLNVRCFTNSVGGNSVNYLSSSNKCLHITLNEVTNPHHSQFITHYHPNTRHCTVLVNKCFVKKPKERKGPATLRLLDKIFVINYNF